MIPNLTVTVGRRRSLPPDTVAAGPRPEARAQPAYRLRVAGSRQTVSAASTDSFEWPGLARVSPCQGPVAVFNSKPEPRPQSEAGLSNLKYITLTVCQCPRPPGFRVKLSHESRSRLLRLIIGHTGPDAGPGVTVPQAGPGSAIHPLDSGGSLTYP